MSTFAFIQCGEQGRVNEDDDWLVRAHCMLGKNTKKKDTKRRPRKKDAALVAKAPKVLARRVPVATSPYGRSSNIPASVREDMSAYVAGPVDRKAWFYLWRFSCFLPDMYPLDGFMDEVPFLEENPCGDCGALTIAMLTASAHNDFVLRLGISNRTRQLTVHTCAYLNDVLSKNDPRSRYSALFGILHLAAAAIFCGEHDSAFTHLYGAAEVFRHFDPRDESQDNPSIDSIESIRFKAERLVFCLFNKTGRKGPLLTALPPWNPIRKNPDLSQRLPISSLPELDWIFYDLRYLCQLVHEKAANRLKVQANYFRNTINSLQNRVMALPEVLANPFEECLRLCISAALSTQTQLPMRRLEHDVLNQKLYTHMPLLECPVDDQEGKDFVFWMVILAFLIAFDADGDSWAESLFRQAADDTETWVAAKMRLAKIIWFPSYMEKQGERTFMRLRYRWPRDRKERVAIP